MTYHPLPTTRPVARKHYRCDVCSTVIQKGEKHVYCSQFYDRTFYAFRHHDYCNDLAAKLTADWDDMDFESCSLSVAFDEWLHECYREWGIVDEMHVFELLDDLHKWRERGDERRVEMTCRAILAQLEGYAGSLIDLEGILREVGSEYGTQQTLFGEAASV